MHESPDAMAMWASKHDGECWAIAVMLAGDCQSIWNDEKDKHIQRNIQLWYACAYLNAKEDTASSSQHMCKPI